MRRDTILLIDDHALFRSGIAAMLSTAFPGIEVRESGSLDDALADADGAPAVLLLDIQLHGISGLEGMASLRRKWPDARVVVVSALDMPGMVEEALSRGAAAFLSKSERPERMIAVLRGLLRGAPDGAADDPPVGPPAGASAEPSRSMLTPRQNEVLDLVCQGLSNKMIGRRLGLSEHTVRGHVQALLATLGATNRAEAAFAARRIGLVR